MSKLYEAMAEIKLTTENIQKVIKMFPRDNDWKNLITKHRRDIDALRRGKDLPQKVEDELFNWALDNNEIKTDDVEELEDFIDRIMNEGTSKYTSFSTQNKGRKPSLSQNKLSSAEYQQAKKLRGFNKDDWKYNGDLYIRVTEDVEEASSTSPNMAKAVQGLNDLGYKLKGRDGKDVQRVEKLFRSGNKKVLQGAIRALDTDIRDQIMDVLEPLGFVKNGVVESDDLDEGFSPKDIKMAIGVASDKRYAGGNMSGAVKAIEKIKKGLSDHPQVSAVLKRQNEEQ